MYDSMLSCNSQNNYRPSYIIKKTEGQFSLVAGKAINKLDLLCVSILATLSEILNGKSINKKT
jgi:hypothetical protein